MTSNDRTLMEPLKVWCKSGLEFIRNGVPDGEKRASIDLDSLLSSLSLPQQQAIVREAKAVVSSWIVLSSSISLFEVNFDELTTFYSQCIVLFKRFTTISTYDVI